MSDFRYEIKTSLPVIWLENIDTKKSGLVRTQRTEQLILVDPVDDEDVEDSSTDWSSKRLTMCDLKKIKNVNTHPIYIVIDHHFLLYFGFGNQNYQVFLMWSQITFLLSIGRTGSQQIDFKVSSLWGRKDF